MFIRTKIIRRFSTYFPEQLEKYDIELKQLQGQLDNLKKKPNDNNCSKEEFRTLKKKIENHKTSINNLNHKLYIEFSKNYPSYSDHKYYNNKKPFNIIKSSITITGVIGSMVLFITDFQCTGMLGMAMFIGLHAYTDIDKD